MNVSCYFLLRHCQNSNIETAPSHDNAVKNTVAPGFCNPSATIYNVQL